MRNFTWKIPTEVVFGRDTERQAGTLVRKYGGSRVLVVYGGGSAVRSGLLDRICASLADAGLYCRTFGGVQPNPRLDKAREGVKLAIGEGIDFLLAVGGGSVIDTAKAIAHGTANPETDIWDFWQRKAPLERSLPVGAVLTIPAAGSEMSDSAVLTDEATARKWGLSTELNRPAFAILNPALTATLPKYQVACGTADILMHTLDRYFNPCADNELTDAIAEALLRTVIANGPAAVDDPGNYHAMSELMWAGSLSHNGLTGLGGQKDFAVHQLGHELSARYDVAHGASLTAVWRAWACYVCGSNPARFARFARNVWGMEGGKEEALAAAGISAMVDFFRDLGLPTTIGALDIILTDGDLDRLADGCSRGRSRSIGSLRVLDWDDMRAIYEAAR